MQRREFITLFSAAATWPFAARAQQPGMPVVGFLHSAAPDSAEPLVAAFRQGLKEGGYVEGENVALEFRWAQDHFDRLPAMATDLVRRQVSVIATMGGPYSNLAAKAATTTIPIVFNTGADPVKMGLVTSLNRPEGNLTGVSFFAEELGSKELGLLHELVPNVTVVGLLVNPSNPETPRQSAATLEAARVLGLQPHLINASSPDGIDKAFDALVEGRAGALLIGADAFFGNRVDQLVGLAARYRMPTMYYRREYTEAGGLVSYGTSIKDAYRQAGIYVARILKGAKPGDLPVMQSTRFEFVINLKTAKALGIDVSPGLSARADEVIE